MIYTLYAFTRVTSRKIKICDFSDFEFLKQITDAFSSSENIQRFVITSHDKDNVERLVYENELEIDKTTKRFS